MYATQPAAIHHALPKKPVFNNVSHSSPSPVTASSPSPRSELAPNVFYSSFYLPLSIIPGPNRDDVVFATEGAEAKWLHPVGSPDQPPHVLPIYTKIVDDLRTFCKEQTEPESGVYSAVVTVSEPKHPAFQGETKKRGMAIGISIITREMSQAMKVRGMAVRSTPVAMRSACVDLDRHHYFNENGTVRLAVIEHLQMVASFTGTDIFVLKPQESKSESAGDPEIDSSQGNRLKIKIYGDHDSVEHCKTRVLIMIDDILGCHLHTIYLDLTMQSLMCGRGKKNVKLIESATGTAIYFPPALPHVYGYNPPNAQRRHADQIFITGRNGSDLRRAEALFGNLAISSRVYVKDTSLASAKIDYLLLERLDEIKKAMETNGTFIQLPTLGSGGTTIRVQGLETLHIERTIRTIMAIASQYYTANWWIISENKTAVLQPSPQDIQKILTDVSACSGADIGFTRNAFDIVGSDSAVKHALKILNEINYIKESTYQVRVQIELAQEHKEFVAGKKNGKINKIMGQSNIHILFDGFHEYNFHIVVVGSTYDSEMYGLSLVEQELPAAMSFHVPDSYHKRIIGVGGQHIQAIMKKYSVFVKFSNAMERGVAGRPEPEDLKVDNVICRTPARNAANLELVKAEIMEMVQQVDAEIVSENVEIPRLHHRTLIAQRSILDDLEKKWSCSVSFPSTEMASDVVTIKGPEWQIPHFKEQFLALVPETHQIKLKWSKELDDVCHGERFQSDVIEPMRKQFGITMQLVDEDRGGRIQEQKVTFMYTRNNAGGLQDSMEMLTNYLLSRGVTTELVKGKLSRPKSDSFEEFSQHFPMAVLQKRSSINGSQDDLHRPGSRLSGDMGVLLGELTTPSESIKVEDGSDTRSIFYNADRRASAPDPGVIGPPRSSGSGSSQGSQGSYHSRSASLDSDWEKLSISRI